MQKKYLTKPNISNLTKEVKDVNTENYKTFMKEIEDDTNKWKNTLCSWIRRTNIVKISILTKAQIQCNLSQIPMAFFTKMGKKPKITLKSQSNSKKEKQSWRHHIY